MALDRRMRNAITAVAATGGVLALAVTAFAGLRSGISTALGAALAAANLWALSRIVAAFLPDSAEQAGGQSRAAWGLLAVLKMTGLLAVAWLLMRHGIVAPVPLLVGVMALPIGIAIGSLVSDRSATSEDSP